MERIGVATATATATATTTAISIDTAITYFNQVVVHLEENSSTLHIGDITRLMYSLFGFLAQFSPDSVRRRTPREWETGKLVHKGEHGVSMIGKKVFFPEHLFQENHGASTTLRRMFGYEKKKL